MNTKLKGEPGSLKQRKIKMGIASLSGIVLVLLTYVIGYVIFDTSKNLVTVLAILLVLPTAKIMVQYFVIPRNNKVDLAEYSEIAAEAAPLKLYCELAVTAQEKRHEILYLIIDKDENIVGYTNSEKAEVEKFEKGVHNFLNYYDIDSKVKLFTDLKQFRNRVKQLSDRNAELTATQKERIEFIFEKLSIMSV